VQELTTTIGQTVTDTEKIEIVRSSWEQATSQKGFWFVVMHGKFVFLETPEDLGIEDGHLQETMMRIFNAKEDAERYAQVVADHQMVSAFDVRVVSRSLEQIFKIFKRMDIDSRKSAYECSCRLELCSMAANEWPKSIDTLWSAIEWRN
jgi:hypothetical protein